ncbi:abortive infection family protein [Pseudomonas sp. MIL19]|uniref:abortive infection family protein n=1 Tax=Pseudomonas sp. MIL19 TaxID=2976979 RepID=UPI002364869A|nr:abortive infection family protein [Pseudomonas sp. MIL19]MDD2162236.1 abortive infection family protein [Pseudomonas sp. MIL19]
MKKEIPAPVIAVLSENMPEMETHASLDNLFSFAEAPGEPPEGSKSVKVQAWLRRVNKEAERPLTVLGRIIECYMELPDAEESSRSLFGAPSIDVKKELKRKLEAILSRCNLTYIAGGIISDGSSAPSRSLAELIKGRDIPSIDAEFTRALANVNTEPREAVSAACNILESIFKTYIADENLEMPQKQDLQNVWKVVRSDLGFEPGLLQDDDLKKILSGVLSVVDGIGAFRTHASSAHGEGRKVYNLKPRHARLAVNSAHTIALFVLETWDERRHR